MPQPPLIDLGIDPPADADLEFVYVGDPMCSWCWGFAPALAQLQERYTIPVRTVVGGLRTGTDAEAMDTETLRHMGRYWDNVAERTGQPFTHAALQRGGWTYDTEPSCRAVVAMRELAPAQTQRWIARLHRAFYVEGVDVTDLSVFPGLLDGFDVDPERYTEVLTDTATLERTRQDFAEARSYGVAGFPTLLFRDGHDLGTITRGFSPWEQLEPALTRWIEENYATRSDGLVCDPATGLC